jgi:hypothetical protein
LLVRMRLASEITHAHLSLPDAQYKKEPGPWFYEYKYSWYYPSLQVDACDPISNSKIRHLDLVAALLPA